MVLTLLALGPAALRRDVVRYRWTRALGAGILERPIGVAYAGGRLYVTDAGANRVVVLDTAGASVTVWGGPRSARGRCTPTDVAVGAGGELYVVDFGHQRVVRFQPVY